MNSRAEAAMQKRDDMSPFMIHLTRNDAGEYSDSSVGGSARENFESILEDKRIIAVEPHCLHGDLIRKLPGKTQRQFRVACFTETPISHLKRFLEVRRGVQLEAYGFVFERDFLYEKDAQPAIYFSEYYGNKAQRQAFDKVYSIAAKGNFTGKTWRILPFVNVMHDGHDFAWEREWRVAADVEFDFSDLVCVILPECEHGLRKKMAAEAIPAIDPDWNHDQVVQEFRKQQRRTRQIWKDKLPKAKPKLALARTGA